MFRFIMFNHFVANQFSVFKFIIIKFIVINLGSVLVLILFILKFFNIIICESYDFHPELLLLISSMLLIYFILKIVN